VTRRRSLRVSVLLLVGSTLVGLDARAVISGRVVDASSREPVPDAAVSLRIAGLETRSDSGGAFSLAPADERLDTLVIEHPAYVPARFVVGGGLEMPAAVTFHLRARAIVDETDEEGLALDQQLADAVMLTGGDTWLPQDFRPFLLSVAHPLELLLYSGLAERISERGDGRRCVELAGADDCAAIWVNGRAVGIGALDERFASEIHGFVVVAPRDAERTLGPVARHGMVMVFLREERR
jgi:hypothetical protein